MSPHLPEHSDDALPRILGLVYGIGAYTAFNVVVVYCIAFLCNFHVPLSVDHGPETQAVSAAFIDCLLLTLFGLQHSVMARPGFKSAFTRFIPAELERSTYVAASALALALVLWQWRPIPIPVWNIETELLRVSIWGLCLTGWFISVAATFMTDHFELMGLKQSLSYFRRTRHVPSAFRERGFYRWVRHPIMLGQIIGFWVTPSMTVGHALFAAVMHAYILIGLYFEERDLLRVHADSYRDYQKRIPKLIPRLPF